MLRAIYPNAACQPELVLPESMDAKTWERVDAIRELLRGRMEVCGPITASELAETLVLKQPEIAGDDAARARSGRLCVARKISSRCRGARMV